MTRRNYWLYVIGCMSMAFILGSMLVILVYKPEDDFFTDYRAEHEKLLGITGDETFNNTEDLGWELIDNNTVIHAWNKWDSYYFNNSNGIQFSNHYNEYWTKNVMMVGYYVASEWNLIYRTDELIGFTHNFTGETDHFMNLTLWKDLSYGSYDFRLAIRYHLGINDTVLTVIPYIKNLGIAIPFDIGFGWEMKDIRISNIPNDNYLNIYNGSSFENILLNQTLDHVFTDMGLNTTLKIFCNNVPGYVYPRQLILNWNNTINYKVTVKNQTGEYNAPVTLFIKVGSLNIDQEKYTELYWIDDDWVNPDSTGMIGSDWTDPDNAKDGNTGTYAYTTVDDSWLWCNKTVNSDKLRVYANFFDRGADAHATDVDIDVYYSGSWHNLLVDGTVYKDTYNEYIYDGGTSYEITSMRIRAITPGSVEFRVKVVQFNQTEIVKTWQTISDTFNGEFINSTNWFMISDTFNGEFINSTNWFMISDTFNGEFTNITEWLIVSDTYNGEFINSTNWFMISDTFNGEFINSTNWFMISDTFNGEFTNITEWLTVSDTYNGEFINTTGETWQTISDTFNGEFINSTKWFMISDTFNGEFINSTNWFMISDTFNGEFINTTIEPWQTISDTFNGEFINTSAPGESPIGTTFNPVNNSIIFPSDLDNISLYIYDPNGDTITYTIELSNGDNITGSSINATINLNLTGYLMANRDYTYWVNLTDGSNPSKYWLSFSTNTTFLNTTIWPDDDIMEIESGQFAIIITLLFFMFFFWMGYLTPKRSAGSLMIVSGFLLLSLDYLLIPFLSAVLVLPLISPIAIFIILLGIRKQFYFVEGDKTKNESS